MGGHFIPVDPFFLAWKARAFDADAKFIELAGEINDYMPHFVVSVVADCLNERLKPLKGAKILILGLAYKPNVDDVRESPALKILELLSDRGSVVDYSDPHVVSFPKMRNYSYDLNSVKLREQSIKCYDCVLLVTDHDAFDYDLIQKHARLIIDTRGKFDPLAPNVKQS